MVVRNDSLELGMTCSSSPRLEKLITTLTQAEHQERYQLSARLAHRLAQQLVQLGEHQVALQCLKRSVQLYKLQTNLTPDFWATLYDWLSLVGRGDEMQDMLETLRPPSQMSETREQDNFLDNTFLANIRLGKTQIRHSPSHETLPPETARLELKFLGKMSCRFGASFHPLRPRFAELLTVLALHPKGLSNEQLTLAVYGENTDVTCCKTELSRLKHLIPIASRPYHLEMPVWGDFLELPRLLKAGRISEAIHLYEGPLLPNSEAPEVCSLRHSLEESLRTVTIESGTGEDLWRLGSRIHDDLELWEAMVIRLPQGDPRRGLARAHVSSLQRSWGL
jgi:hypothetical protein